jgi:hypothetical protein
MVSCVLSDQLFHFDACVLPVPLLIDNDLLHVLVKVAMAAEVLQEKGLFVWVPSCLCQDVIPDVLVVLNAISVALGVLQFFGHAFLLFS